MARDYKKLNVVMYVKTYKSLREYSKRTGVPMIRIIFKALTYSLKHFKNFKKFSQWYNEWMAGEITTLRTFSISEENHWRIKNSAEKLKLSISMWVDSAVAFYLENVDNRS